MTDQQDAQFFYICPTPTCTTTFGSEGRSRALHEVRIDLHQQVHDMAAICARLADLNPQDALETAAAMVHAILTGPGRPVADVLLTDLANLATPKAPAPERRPLGDGPVAP